MSTVMRAMRIGTSVGTRSTAQVSSAAGVPPYWALESHGPWVRRVAITASGPSGTNMASTPTS